MIDAVVRQVEADQPTAVRRLCDWLAIPSVSTDPAHRADVIAAANWLVAQLEGIGLDARLEETGGHPAVVARTTDATLLDSAKDRARVLFYGHYDVQPPDPVEQWTTPPFEPNVRDGRVYARGACDDKGQVMTFIEALRAWKQAAGGFPVPITVLVEGEEESGSAHLPAFIEKHRATLDADVCIICDTGMWRETVPAITYGLRGLVYFDVQLHGPARDLHSGVYGGVLANPATMLTRVLGRLFDEQHRVTVPGFYDDVLPLTDAERADWAKLGFDEAAFLGSAGVETPFGEAGFTTLERNWARPSCDVNGIYGGYMGRGAKTVIPRMAGAKVSFRLVANQDPARIARAFEAWLRGQDVGGCRWEITPLGEGHPVMVSRDSAFVAAAQRAIHEAAGVEAALIREGASIPVVADIQRMLKLDSLLIGFGRHDDCIHSPDEKFELANFKLGCTTHAHLLAELAKVEAADH